MKQLVEQQQELAVQKSKFDETTAAVAAIRETRVYDDLDKVEPKADAGGDDIGHPIWDDGPYTRMPGTLQGDLAEFILNLKAFQ